MLMVSSHHKTFLITFGDAMIIDFIPQMLVTWWTASLLWMEKKPKTAPVELKKGEYYAGIIVDQPYTASYHLVLIPGRPPRMTWQQSMDWAASIDADLPTRREQALLFANLRWLFQPEWHWSNMQNGDEDEYSWYQDFGNCYQGYYYKTKAGHARAVRRVPIASQSERTA